MHKDEAPLLEYIAWRLSLGQVSRPSPKGGGPRSSPSETIGSKKDTVNYTVIKKVELLKIFSIFDKQPFNTTKNFNYILFRQAYDIYFNREFNKVSPEIFKEIINIKNQMNKKRIEFDHKGDHSIHITHYWLLGFTEGDGYFSLNKPDFSLKYGIGQNYKELAVMEAIQKFLLNLPGKYSIKRSNTNLVKLATYNSAKGRGQEPSVYITVNQTDFITNVLLPFFDNLTWLSKKKYDYQDWKLILNIRNQGKHFTDKGKELILLIANRMNNNRLSTNIAKGNPSSKPEDRNIKERALKLLSSPSNYEIQSDGKILIKSSGTYLKGRGNVGIKVLDEKGELIFNFNSIKDCALFFNVHSRTIVRRLNNGNFSEFKGKILVFKREISLP